MKRSRRFTAYHEAGHAVIAELEGWPVVYVTAVPHEDTDGHALIDYSSMPGEYEDGFDAALKRKALVSIAGAVAVEVAGGPEATESFSSDATGTWDDAFGPTTFAECAWKILGEPSLDYDPQALTEYLATLVGEVRNRLSQARPVVDRLAQRLLEVDRVEGDEVRQMVMESGLLSYLQFSSKP